MDNKEMEMKAREHDMTSIDAEGAEEVVQKIRSQYVEKENTELDELRELDAKVKRPANVFAHCDYDHSDSDCYGVFGIFHGIYRDGISGFILWQDTM